MWDLWYGVRCAVVQEVQRLNEQRALGEDNSANKITLIRGSGKLAGKGVVEVAGVRYTASDVVVATGSEPFIPPIPGLRELDGIWTNREATGMKSVPRRLLVLGAGAAGLIAGRDLSLTSASGTADSPHQPC